MAVNYNPKVINDGLVLYLDGANPRSYSTAQNLIPNSDAKNASGTTMPTSWFVLQRMGEAYNGQEAAFPSNMSSGVDTNGYGYFKFDVIGTTRSGNLMVLGTDNGRNRYLKRNTTYTISYNYNLPSSFLNASPGLGIFFAPQYYTAAGVSINTPASNIQANQRRAGLNRTTFTFTTPDADIGYTLPRFQFGAYAPSIGPVDYRDFYLGGVQLEEGSSATTYNPTGENTIYASPQASEAILPGVWQDLSPNKIPYSVQNFLANTAVYRNGYVSFAPESYNSDSTYFQIRDPRIVNLTSNLTVETCVYLTGNAIGDTQLQNRIVSGRYQESGSPWGFRVMPNRTVSTGGISYEINTNPGGTWFIGENAFIPTSVIDNHKWVYVTQVQDDNSNPKTLKTYVNGVLQATLNYTGTPNSGGGINIGRGYYAGTRNASGRVAFLRMYNRPLNATEVSQNYSAMRGRFESTYQPLVVDSSLKLWLDAGNSASYPGTGATWTDLTGSNIGTLINSPAYNSTLGNFEFTGTQYVNINRSVGGAMIGVTPGSDTFTICGWVRSTSAGGYFAWFTKQAGGTRLDLGINVASELYFTTYNATSGLTDQGQFIYTITLNTWYHFALVCTTGSKKVYVNGIRQTFQSGDSTFTSSWPGDASPAIVGGDRRWVGSIAQIQVYNRALIADEIAQNFNSGRARFGL